MESKQYLSGICILSIFLIFFFSGCVQQQTNTRYVCSDGSSVSDPSSCPRTQNQPQREVRTYCGDGTCDSDENCRTCPIDCGDCPIVNEPVRNTPQEVKNNRLTQDDVSYFEVEWRPVDKNLFCSENFCKANDCDRTTFLMLIYARFQRDVKCTAALDNNDFTTPFSMKQIWLEGSEFQNGYHTMGQGKMGSNFYSGKSAWWDSHIMRFCCYAADDSQQQELCLTKKIEAYCP